ncbi:MAG TPA: sugar phosphate isomerase/epimerase family protein [Verrucomicrobiae bacterium]|nr:sugar phosphate isomerase/epimerase family protein [Verrucomicrobiae bacterium]
MNHRLSRRGFLKRASILPWCAAGIRLGTVTAMAIEPIKRAGAPSLKISCNAYSFAKLLDDHLRGRGSGITLFDFVDFCAKQNFDGIDVTGYYFPGYSNDGPGVPTDQYIFELKRRAFNLGLGISGTGVRDNFTVADKSARARDVQRIKNWVEVAAKLGAPVIRVFADTQMRDQTWQTASRGATRDQVEEWIATDVRACADYAGKFGVIIGVQNHGDFLKTADNLINLLKRIDSPWCGAIVDTGKFDVADPYAEIAKVAPFAVNWQIKQSPFGVETVETKPTDLKRLIRIIRESDYRGYLPIETLSPRGGAGYDPFVVVPKFLSEVREAIAATT